MTTTPRRDAGHDAERQARERAARAAEEKRRVDRLVDAESEQSFPASDPPSWTLGADKG